MDSNNNLYSSCDWALYAYSPDWGTRYWCFGLARKAFLSTTFLWIKVHQSNGTNLDSQNSLHSFCDWALETLLPIGINHFNALVWHGKFFFPPFSLESKLIHQLWHAWILLIISILFMVGHYKLFLLTRIHSFDALFWQEKLFFLYFP